MFLFSDHCTLTSASGYTTYCTVSNNNSVCCMMSITKEYDVPDCVNSVCYMMSHCQALVSISNERLGNPFISVVIKHLSSSMK